ncbi:DUF1192 domain-containing protein [Phreatobacter sp.]|uniref:DUF1192 domain-containing protein n=1 Tax=Phreatobacter sp. TaxID=1966341 RepID=UPI0022C2613C|nr:DUF1192 domain-containing protein [Phreatobacter sp.]MCZ8315403.1 DUF1192 domain-containing protein [Phreatobacter sp.]
MFDDDLKPRPKPPAHVVGQDLAALSVHELAERIALLKEEITRLEADMAKKEASKSAAASVFKF